MTIFAENCTTCGQVYKLSDGHVCYGAQPVTFEALKKRWRTKAATAKQIQTLDSCADELESLEQQVRAVRAKLQAQAVKPKIVDLAILELTALLGGK